MHKSKLLFYIIICLPGILWGQVKTNTSILKQTQLLRQQQDKALSEKLINLAFKKGWKLVITGNNGQKAILTDVDLAGYPLYTTTFSNVAAAATINTTQIWPGGRTGLALNGSSENVKGKMGIWDGGKIRNTHVELVNRILQKDNAPDLSDHATHVTGTLVAAGINPPARGMAFGLQQLIAYDFTTDVTEMFGEANNLLVSNHSYGTISGWRYNETEKRWEFHGEANATQDYKFGFYDNKSMLWDSIAYNAPYYLIVMSAGNNRNENGPAVGQPYWRYDANNELINAGNRPDGISSNNGYDIIPGQANAKNILTVGAAGTTSGGYSRPEDVALSTFSSYGPTDDGRIKPDVVAAGVNLLSTISTNDNAYATFSGTSMSSPNAAGSLFLLQEHFSKVNSGRFMRAATLKGLAIHTAEEAGPLPGPDYQYGFGLLNIEKAANVISSRNTDQLIQENVLSTGNTYSFTVVASGKGELVATLSWTDPKAVSDFTNRLNSPVKKLVNDLDLVIKRGTTTYLPYVLNPSSPAAAATRGDNVTDNVEKVLVSDVVPGQTYTIEVKHKGTLQRNQQAYSLLVSGVGGVAYCASSPLANTGARIDSVALGIFNFVPGPGCTTYQNLTNNTIVTEANQTLSFSVKVGSCDGSVTNKVVKAFIDYNNDGDFTDANELIAQSGVIAGNGVFTTNITTIPNLPINYLSRLRIVVVETNNAGEVVPCGNYARGETQDYRLRFAAPSRDVGISEIVSPNISTCNNKAQLITVKIRNYGSTVQSAIPLSVTITKNNVTVATLNAIYPVSIAGYAEGEYTFQSPVDLQAGTYTITALTNAATDQNISNNQVIQTVVVTAPSAPSGTAEICSATEAKLGGTPSAGDVLYWYDSPTAINPIASGTFVTTNVIPANKTYYVAKNIKATVGPITKLDFPNGGYNSFSGNYINFSNDVPVTIESARLYIGNAGRVNIIVADIISSDATTGSYSYRPISSKMLTVYPTTPNPQAGAVNGNNAADTGAVFYLNLAVPTPGQHVIIVQCMDGATIFRNNGVSPNPYPFAVPGVFSITGNSATLASDPNYFQTFYYFFYAMKIATAGCESARVPVAATTTPLPVISLSGNVLTSSVATGNQWYRNDVGISGATGQTFTAAEPGIYKVINVSTFGCIANSNEINIAATSVVDVNVTAKGLQLFPNPNKGKFQLDFEVEGKDDLNISLINFLGQKVYQSTYSGFTGRFKRALNVGKQAKGVYILRIDHNKKIFVKKIIID